MLESRDNQFEIVSRLNVARSVIYRLRTRFHQTGSITERPRSGTLRKTIANEDDIYDWKPVGTLQRPLHTWQVS